MSIEQTDMIDIVGIDNLTKEVVLTISDHLDWTEGVDDHLLLLQEKINTYLIFIESGEIYAEYPNEKGALLLIDVICKFPLNIPAMIFYEQAAQIVAGAGVRLRHRLLGA